jgi:hypothetical protein
MDVVLKQEESRANGQGGCSKGREDDDACWSEQGPRSHPHALGKSQAGDEYPSHFGHKWRLRNMPL